MPRRQVVLVTGCSSGIGRAAALEAAARGHRVCATARDIGSLSDLEGRPGIRTLPLDVTDAASIAAAVSAALSGEGRIDALVNNAGFGRYGAVEEVTVADWREQFEVNVFGAVAMISAVLPAMREARSGTIVNVSSVAGRIPIPFASPYCASKHALEAVSDALRVEAGAFGVRVVVVEPGPIESRFSDRARQGVSALLGRPGPYSDVYRNAESAMRKEFQAGVLPPEAVARVIVNAIESPRPKSRYAVGRMPRVLFALKRVLTDRAFDRAMRRALKMR
ncbi:MAG: SDR family NAD(P)-dependent oxidoreductase [Acidobacteria bacterium]|nr:SDR family NAD(P)-dependent oxidoreductase [Acidobacteriota bacterium]MCA1609450.1 SDR family NAD(P)-dependent oxidoreductase [Acidobacteriota bacterium]